MVHDRAPFGRETDHVADPVRGVLTHEEDPVADAGRKPREIAQHPQAQAIPQRMGHAERREDARVLKTGDGRTRRTKRGRLAGREIEVRAPGARDPRSFPKAEAQAACQSHFRQKVDFEVSSRLERRREPFAAHEHPQLVIGCEGRQPR